MSNGSGSRVLIPENARKTIQRIREITGKQHSDEDVYSVLKECSMDPNETAQKLLYLDTFHEVKSRRDRRKETPNKQAQGPARGRRGNFSSKYNNSEAASGGRNAAPQREYGVNHMKDGGPTSPKINNTAALPVAKPSTVTSNGPFTLPNGSSSHGRGHHLPARDVKVTKDRSAAEVLKMGIASSLPAAVPASSPTRTPGSVTQPKQGKAPSSLNNVPNSPTPTSVSDVYSSASDPILALSMTRHPAAVSAIKREVVSEQNGDEQNHVQRNSDDAGSQLPKDKNAESKIVNSVNTKMALGDSKPIETNKFSEPLKPSSQLANDDSLANKFNSHEGNPLGKSIIPVKAIVSSEGVQANASTPSLHETTGQNGHVIFPNHIKVPEALKSGLTFGSFSNGNSSDVNSTHANESMEGNDETAREPSSSSESDSSTIQVDHSVQSEPAQRVLDEVPLSGTNLAPNANSKVDQWALGEQAKQEMMLLTEGNQNHSVQLVPNCGIGIMPTIHGGQHVQFEGHETQAWNFVAENNTASSSPSPPPPVQNSLAASPHLLYRPPYPPNFLQYTHYLNPYFFPPMHQFLSHNGIPQQPSTGNAYLTSAASAPGVKFPLAQFKPGTSGGNLTPIGFPPLYGSYGSSPIGFNPGPAVTSGVGAGNEDLSASQLKESHVYTTGPLGEVSTWIPPPGQDISGMQPNSMYHLSPQGQPLTLSTGQAGHGHFPGIYPPVQTMNASATVNPLLQQCQPLSAAGETMGPPSAAYQQPQLAHISWNSSY